MPQCLLRSFNPSLYTDQRETNSLMILLTKVAFISCKISIQLLLVADTFLILFLNKRCLLPLFEIIRIHLFDSLPEILSIPVQVPYPVLDILNDFTWCNINWLNQLNFVRWRSLRSIVRWLSSCREWAFQLHCLFCRFHFQQGQLEIWWVFTL